jgi:hypothetical protein
VHRVKYKLGVKLVAYGKITENKCWGKCFGSREVKYKGKERKYVANSLTVCTSPECLEWWKQEGWLW